MEIRREEERLEEESWPDEATGGLEGDVHVPHAEETGANQHSVQPRMEKVTG